EEAARERGYELVLCNTDDEAEREKASLRVLRERQADGLLIATSRMADATLASVRRERFPFVLVNRGSRVAADPAVEVNNSRAAARDGRDRGADADRLARTRARSRPPRAPRYGAHRPGFDRRTAKCRSEGRLMATRIRISVEHVTKRFASGAVTVFEALDLAV